MEFQKRGLTNRDVAKDAKSFGMRKIDEPSLSKYLNSGTGVLHGSLTEYSIYWLCVRYGLEIKVLIEFSKSSFRDRVKKMISLFFEVNKEEKNDPKKFQKLINKAQLKEDYARAAK